jgi:hypothetical protein
LGVLLAFKLKFPEDDPQVEPLCGVLTGLGKESAIFDIEKEDLLGFGVAFFRGTFEEEEEPCPKAEVTKSPNKLGFLLTIPMLGPDD